MSASLELELMRASALLENDPAAAARRAIAILAKSPGRDEAILLLAAARRRLGGTQAAADLQGGADSMESLARRQPASPLLQLELGLTYAACGRTREAIAALERSVGLDGGLTEGWRELAVQQLLAGNTAAADVAYLNYRRLAADPADLADAYAAFDESRLDAADAAAQSRLPASTNPVAVLTLLAAIAAKRGDDLAEEDALNRILSLAPCDNAARRQLAQLLLRLERSEEALPMIERLLAADSRNGAILVLKSEALQLAERHGEGLDVEIGRASCRERV